MVDLRRQFSFVRFSLSHRISSSKGREREKTVDEKREKGGVMVVVVSILILHILLKQINNYHSFVLSKSYAQCSVCDDHRRRYIHLILSLTRESFYRLVMKHSEREKKQQNSCL